MLWAAGSISIHQVQALARASSSGQCREDSVRKGLFCLSPYKSSPSSQTTAFLAGITFLAGQQGQNDHSIPSLHTCKRKPELSCMQGSGGQPTHLSDVLLQCRPSCSAQTGRNGENSLMRKPYTPNQVSMSNGPASTDWFWSFRFVFQRAYWKEVNKTQVLLVNECIGEGTCLSQYSLYFRVQW